MDLKRLKAEPRQAVKRLKASASFGSDTVHTPDTELAYFAAYPRHDNCSSLLCRSELYAFDVQRLDSMISFDDSRACFAYLLHAQNFAHWLQPAYSAASFDASALPKLGQYHSTPLPR